MATKTNTANLAAVAANNAIVQNLLALAMANATPETLASLSALGLAVPASPVSENPVPEAASAAPAPKPRKKQQPKAQPTEAPAKDAMAWDEQSRLAKRFKETANSKALANIASAKKKHEEAFKENASVMYLDSLDRQKRIVQDDIRRQTTEFQSNLSNNLLSPNKVLKALRDELQGDLANEYPDVVRSIGSKSPQIKHCFRRSDGTICTLKGITHRFEMQSGDEYIAFTKSAKDKDGNPVTKTQYYAIRPIDFGCGNVKSLTRLIAQSIRNRNTLETKAKDVISEFATPHDYLATIMVDEETIFNVLSALKLEASPKDEYTMSLEAKHNGVAMKFTAATPIYAALNPAHDTAETETETKSETPAPKKPRAKKSPAKAPAKPRKKQQPKQKTA